MFSLLTRRPAVRLTVEALEERQALTLQAVADTTAYPSGATVQLEVDFHGHLISGGGALIDPNHILTAAHLLYDPTYGLATSVAVFAGRNGLNVEPYGVANGTHWVVHQSYVRGAFAGQSDYDIGLITLDRNLGNITGYFGVSALVPDSYFDGAGPLNILEYPGDTHSGFNQYLGSGPSLSADANNINWLLNNIPIEHGASGAPVFVKDSSGAGYVVGIVSELSATEGIATRITSSKLHWLITQLSDSSGGPSAAPTPDGPSTPGVFNPSNAVWYLHNSNNAGAADAGAFAYGGVGWLPVVGDWDGDGVKTVGVVDPNGTWYLRNSNTPGAPDFTPFAYGSGDWIPVVGDWDGNGTTTIGMFDPTTATWYLRNSNSPGAPSVTPFRYGAPGDIPVVGDWNGDGQTTIGVVDPKTETWYLRNSNTPGAPDITAFRYGAPGWLPVVGDWSGNGTTGIGVVDPKTEAWYLRNSASPGATDYAPFAYGAPGWLPIGGDWRGLPGGQSGPTTHTALVLSDAALGAIATANTSSPPTALLVSSPAGTAPDDNTSASLWQHALDDGRDYTDPWPPFAHTDDPLAV
jgi:V8-like Glu-specific endopeptidase